MKKRVNKNVSKKSALSGAIKDLEIEISELGKEKREIQQSLNKISSAINVDHQLEKEMQEKIARLAEKEARLNQKKKNLQTDIDSVSDKLNKIAKIKCEMADI